MVDLVDALGYHPWFTHQISTRTLSKEDHYKSLFLPSAFPPPAHVSAFQSLLPHLPDPTPLSDILSDLRHNLSSYPRAMLGEVGLDRSFRVALDYTVSPRELTPFTIPFDHQLAILEAQLGVAVELGRNVSMHSVKSQLGTTELLARMNKTYGEKWNGINVDMHSCGLSAQMWRGIEVSWYPSICYLSADIIVQKKHANIYLSLSTVINVRPNSSNHKLLIEACAADRILVESDFNDVDYCTQRTWDMINIVAQVKGWTVEEEWDEVGGEVDRWGVVRRLEANWKAFERGGSIPERPQE
jgi:Tat protein secretion system quality control protein TatD with DNase activity